MPVLTLIKLFGFGFGTILTVVLFSLSVQKQNKRYDDYAFGSVLLLCLLWNGGSFLYTTIFSLFGQMALNIAEGFRWLGYLGLGFMPSAMLHVHLAILIRQRLSSHTLLSRRHKIAFISLYAPGMFLFLSALNQWPPMIPFTHRIAFIVWSVVAVLYSA